jgi:hypothetical protein
MEISVWTGTIGVSMILTAYLLNLFNRLNAAHPAFILLNFIGAGLACLAAVLIHYLPFIILEGIWTFISLIALFKYNIHRNVRRKESA